jgi:hypothetical protein
MEHGRKKVDIFSLKSMFQQLRILIGYRHLFYVIGKEFINQHFRLPNYFIL